MGYGAALGVLTGGVLLPAGLNAVGATDPPVPLLPIPGPVGEFTFPVVFGVAHLVYGALLGAVYAAITGVGSAPRTDETGIGSRSDDAGPTRTVRDDPELFELCRPNPR